MGEPVAPVSRRGDLVEVKSGANVVLKCEDDGTGRRVAKLVPNGSN